MTQPDTQDDDKMTHRDKNALPTLPTLPIVRCVLDESCNGK